MIHVSEQCNTEIHYFGMLSVENYGILKPASHRGGPMQSMRDFYWARRHCGRLFSEHCYSFLPFITNYTPSGMIRILLIIHGMSWRKTCSTRFL